MPPKITDPIQTIEILFNKNPVSVIKSVKYFGITIDEKLNFAERIIKLTRKISRSVGILAKLRNILPFAAHRKWYYSMVDSHLLYGIVIWGNSYDNYLKRLIILQNKVVKTVAGGQRQEHVTPFYHRLHILKLKDLYVLYIKLQNYCPKTHEKSYRFA